MNAGKGGIFYSGLLNYYKTEKCTKKIDNNQKLKDKVLSSIGEGSVV